MTVFESWAEKLTVIWDSTLGPFFLLANILLIFIISKYTPESTKTYASIILTITISDCFSLIGNFMASPRVLPRGNQVFMIFRGKCITILDSDIEKRAQMCLYFYSMQMQFYILNHVILISSYIYRMLIITHPFGKYDKRKVVNGILWIYSLGHVCYFHWVWYSAIQPMEVINREISKFETNISISGATYNGVVDLSAPSQIVFNMLAIFSPFIVLVVVVFCRWRIFTFFKKYEYSEAVKKMHKALETIFSAQAIGPLLSSLTCILYVILPKIGASHSTTVIVEELMGRPLVLMYIVNPIVTITFMTPYKHAVLKWFTYTPLKEARPAVSSTQNTRPIMIA